MKCIIPGSNVKVFGRAVHCLSKVGEDLYMEPLETGLALRAVNSSRSAYSCFLFSPNFFLKYDDGSSSASQTQQTQSDTKRWRVTMKSCLAVFKSLSSLEKNVDRCSIHLDLNTCRLVFLLHCRHGILKTYNLVYQETETLQAVYSKDLCPNRITAPAKLLAEAVGSFQSSQEEVMLSVTPTQVGFKNYVDEEPDPSKVVHSELRLAPEEFSEYNIGVDTELTFSLKDLRAILSFTDAAGLSVSVHFETSGKPIVFSVDSDQTVEATFVLATLAEMSGSQMTTASQTARLSQVTPAVTHHSHRSRGVARASSSTTKSAARKGRGDGDARSFTNGGRNEEEFPDDLLMDLMARTEKMSETNNGRDDASEVPTHLSGGDVSASPVIPLDPSLSARLQQAGTSSTHRTRMEEGGGCGTSSTHRTEMELAGGRGTSSTHRTEGELSGPEDESRVGGANLLLGAASSPERDGDSDEGFDFIPATPPSKKFRSMFFGASQSQQSQPRPTPSQPNPGAGGFTVLAADSDED